MARGGIEGTGGRPASPSGGARSAGARSGGSGGSAAARSGGIARAAEQAAARAAKARKARADRAAYLKKYNMKRMPADAFTLTQLKNQMRPKPSTTAKTVRVVNPNGATREMSPRAARKAFETWIRDEQKAGRLGSLTEPVGAGRTKPGKPAVKAKTPAKKAQVASLKAKAKASGKPRTRLVETRQSSANYSRQMVARANRASRGSA